MHYPTRQFLTCLGWALLAFAIPGFTRADDRQILVAPGPDLEKVIAFLERIKAGYVVASGPLERLRVHGRVSRVIKSWSPDVREQTEKTMPAPDWLPFLLVERGLKRRYEQEYRVLGPKPSDEKVNVLMNPEGVFKLDDRRLFILNLTHYQTDWSDVASGIYGASMVFDGVKYGPLDVVCDSLIQQLRGTGQLDWNSRHFTLQCKSENGLLCVERLDDVKLGKPRLPNSFSFIVDPKRGFRSIRFVRRWGGPGLNLDYEERREVEMNEVLPGVYFQRRGREFVKNLGPIPEKESTAGWALARFECDKIEIGDFDYDDKQFDTESLPIPKGADVEDRRFDPPLHLTFGQSPLNEQAISFMTSSRDTGISRRATFGPRQKAGLDPIWRICRIPPASLPIPYKSNLKLPAVPASRSRRGLLYRAESPRSE